MSEALQRARQLLLDEGYSFDERDDSLVVSVQDNEEEEGEESLGEIRALLGRGYWVDWTGDSRTDSDGDTSSDVSICVLNTNGESVKRVD